MVGKSLATLGLALAILGLALVSGRDEAWGQSAPSNKSKKSSRNRTRRQNPPGVPIPNKAEPKKAEDPLAKPARDQAQGAATGKFHYTLKIRSFDGATQLASSYYPPNPAGSSAPVVLLIHDFGRSRKDFEDAIGDLKGEGLAEHLQGLGFAVLSVDLRGQGQNTRRALSANDRELMAQDLQAAYQFLVDRHNRGELNLSKFGVLGIGEGANLVAAWAFQPGAAMTIDERPSDLNAMILVSPNPTGHGYRLDQLLDTLGSRFPILLMAGDKDKASSEAARAASVPLGRSRLNKIARFPSSLHGYTLLRLEPKVTGDIIRFLETALKGRAAEYEPRYNLNPIAYSDIRTQKNSARATGAAKAKEQPKAAEKPKAQEKAKAGE
jgi:alpha-beta hydrolase superfamily lysophospholipase